MRGAALALAALLLAATSTIRAENPVSIGSKKFTESVILGEMATLTVEAAGLRGEHRAELGGTRILWNALRNGEVDIYPEYTGTMAAELFADRPIDGEDDLRAALAEHGIRMTPPLGFDNTYAIGMTRDGAAELGATRISDLRRHPELRLGFTNEFMDREDGWPGMRRAYDLPQTDVVGLDHDLAYRGLAQGAIAVTDLYSTDAEIRAYDLVVLDDDRSFFPAYRAVLLYRESLADAHPELARRLEALGGTIDDATMTAMNAAVKLDGRAEVEVAAEHLRERMGWELEVSVASWRSQVATTTADHLFLVAVSMLGAIVCAVPLGVWSARSERAGRVILSTVGIVQTIPALALLVLMMPLLQALGLRSLGTLPAVIALFLYSLLPIVRNTHAGLTSIPSATLESADALGLPQGARLRLVELPIAAPTILAGVKTAAVINIGFATLGALIGAGGYGQPILTGIRLDDPVLILQGAVPAALLAIGAQGLFELAERWLARRARR